MKNQIASLEKQLKESETKVTEQQKVIDNIKDKEFTESSTQTDKEKKNIRKPSQET